jgi:predicted Ser/Thr protein kinase
MRIYEGISAERVKDLHQETWQRILTSINLNKGVNHEDYRVCNVAGAVTTTMHDKHHKIVSVKGKNKKEDEEEKEEKPSVSVT